MILPFREFLVDVGGVLVIHGKSPRNIGELTAISVWQSSRLGKQITKGQVPKVTQRSCPITKVLGHPAIPARADSAAKVKISTTCRIPVEPFDYVVKAGKPARKKGVSQGDTLGEKICKSRVDFPPPRSTSKWSR